MDHPTHRLLVALALAAALSARPAAAAAQSLHVGSKLGAASATLRSASLGEEVQRGARFAAATGVVLRLELDDVLALQGEVLYGEKGYDEGPGARMRKRYLEAPLLARVAGPWEVLGFRPVAFAGVAPAAELSCDGTTTGYYVRAPPDPSPLDCSSVRSDRTDWATVYGGGVTTERMGVTFTAEARTTRGRTDIGSAWSSVEVRNSSWMVALEATLRLAG